MNVIKKDAAHHDTGDAVCPACNRSLNRATQINGCGPAPSPGDLSICYYCCAVLQFLANEKFRALEDRELATLPDGPREMLLNLRKRIAAQKIRKTF